MTPGNNGIERMHLFPSLGRSFKYLFRMQSGWIKQAVLLRTSSEFYDAVTALVAKSA
jgi:hypothetical protein